MISTPLCDALGITHPIISAPMGPNLSDVDLAAAVSAAGGLGMLQAQLSPPEEMREKIREIRRRTGAPFGVNFILHFPSADGLAVCVEERVPVVTFFWGDPAPHIGPCHDAGITVGHQVGSAAAARDAADKGVDFVIAQGADAGGHLAGEVGTLALVPRVVDAAGGIPVVAAGGIADGRGVLAALALGAGAAMLGTRFLASAEANAHPDYKRRLVEAGETDTVRTTLFDAEWPDAPHRVLRTPFVEEWHNRPVAERRAPDQPLIGETEVAGITHELRRFMGFPPCGAARGDVASMCFAAGQGVGLVDAVAPAAEIVATLIAEAEAALARSFSAAGSAAA